MRVKCQQRELLNALNICARAISANNTLQVLNNLLLRAEGKSMVISATDLELAITATLDANILNEGKVTVPAKLINSYVSYLKDSLIELQIEEGLNLSIKTPGTKTIIKGINAEEFPAIPIIDHEYIFEVKSNDFCQAINQVVFAASINKSRPILTGVYFEVIGNILKIVATDSYRLSEKIIKINNKTKTEIKCIIPAKSVMELGKIISGSEEKINVVLSKTQASFKGEKVELISRLIEGEFPDYKQIIPQSPKSKVIVDLNDLKLTIKRINLFAKENSNNIKLDFKQDNVLRLTTQATQYGSEEDELPIKLEGEDNNIALNSDYLLEIFSNIEAEKIILEIESSLSPVLIKLIDRDDFLHIIMPLKI